MKNEICVGCLKPITGKMYVNTFVQKSGNKNINKTEFYCKKCFKQLSMEKALNELREKKSVGKAKGSK